MDAIENALLLIQSVRSALDRGVKHYSVDGRLLSTEKEIIESLAADGQICLEEPRPDKD